MKGSAALAVVATAALRLWACADPTQITVSVTTDLPCTSIRGMTFSAGPPGTIETGEIATSTTTCVAGEPRTLVLVPTEEKDAPVAVRVVVGVERPATECTPPLYKGCIVARRTLRYLPHTPLTLPIHLERSCLDVPCDSASSCRASSCVSANASCANGTCAIPADAPVVSIPDAGGAADTGARITDTPPDAAPNTPDASDVGDAAPDALGTPDATADAAAPDAGAPDAGADAGESGPMLTLDVFATRPAGLGDAAAPDAAAPNFHTWLAPQVRSISGTAERLGPLLVGLDTANRVRVTLSACPGGCDKPTVSFITSKGTFPGTFVPIGGPAEFELTTSPADPASVVRNDDMCIVVSSPSLAKPRRVLVRVMLGDFDGNGIVDATDFVRFNSDIDASTAMAVEKHSDLNSNGRVEDPADFDIFRSAYATMRDAGDPCGP